MNVLKLNRRHYGLLRTNDKDDDETQPFYLLFIGKIQITGYFLLPKKW